jgi:pre-rRNA-processing protein TSR4
MSQLLHYFRVETELDPVDWATIVVYTCGESCDKSVSYKEEFVRVQFSPPTRRIYRTTS